MLNIDPENKNTFASEVMSYVLMQIECLPSGRLISTDDVLYDGPFWAMTDSEYQIEKYNQSILCLAELEFLPMKHVGQLDTGYTVYRVTSNCC